MKYEYVIFSPYFGHLPNNFELWLKSCSFNKNFKFIVLTDDVRDFDCPENVEIIKMSFDELRKKIQSKFDFKISLETPYKLCDYKVTYGYVFDDLLLNCKYWGYCDLDLIFGDLKKFMPDTEYDKISHLGPFCLYKNNLKINKAFMQNGYCKFNYKNILSSKVHFGFDEIGKYGINSIFEKNNLSIYDYQKNAADINCILEGMNITSGHSGTYSTDIGKRVFEFNKGKIYGYSVENEKLDKKEYAYIHFQKRKMENNCEKKDNFIILHHSFEDLKDRKIDKEYILENQPSKKMYYKRWVKFKMKAVKVRIKRLFVIIRNR